MKRILELILARRLARTPLGLVLLGIGWWIIRKRRADRAGRVPELREPGREPRGPHMWQGPSDRGRRRTRVG
ncbi:hypothetical protein GCM10023194_19340 [Planotetraspora phitsanulokensis]|uniref:Uncharacterized protein n=1 Tax=Planotetraspora phitsanulokensis TaxID=575192 RepID=A0A8J3UIJ0_9ACTN|nr:DUF6203 family protein [Planotetraspora phitsanulokensis]GII39435.1 hypothetical protein Pph01_44380 [Planotetraspora phitsanulokensis]